jgi:hypothetical protein
MVGDPPSFVDEAPPIPSGPFSELGAPETTTKGGAGEVLSIAPWPGRLSGAPAEVLDPTTPPKLNDLGLDPGPSFPAVPVTDDVLDPDVDVRSG